MSNLASQHRDDGSMQLYTPDLCTDLDAITTLAMTAMWDDPIWPFRYPYAKEYPEHHYRYSRARYEEYLKMAEAGSHKVIVVKAPSYEEPSINKIIAVGIWALPGSHAARSDAGEGDLPRLFPLVTCGRLTLTDAAFQSCRRSQASPNGSTPIQ